MVRAGGLDLRVQADSGLLTVQSFSLIEGWAQGVRVLEFEVQARNGRSLSPHGRQQQWYAGHCSAEKSRRSCAQVDARTLLLHGRLDDL